MFFSFSFNSFYFSNISLTYYMEIKYIRDGSRFSNIRIFYLILEYRLGCAIIF